MRDRGKNRSLGAALFGATGWLFADLLLALAMIFLLAEPSNQTIAPPGYKAPLPTCVPSPAPIATLDNKEIDFSIRIDANGILGNNKNAVNNAESAVKNYLTTHGYKDRRAGVVLLYGGALGQTPGYGGALATHFYDEVIKKLGNERFVFYPVGTVAHKDLHDLSTSPATLEINMWLFSIPRVVKPVGCTAPTPVPTAAADTPSFG